MPDFLSRIFDQIKNGSQGLSTPQKISLMIAVAAVLTAIIVTSIWSKKPHFQLVYSGVGSENMSEIASAIDERKIPYKLSADGMSISVPSDRVPEVRLMIAGEGLAATGGAGFELFDDKNIGMTDFMQKLNFQRALQGELARTISQLSEVENARVHIVMQKESLFRDKEESASASVVVRLKRGKGLSPSQIEGVVQLVASAVEGMEPEKVTVVDSRGNVLTRSGRGGMSDSVSSNLEMQRAFEKELEHKITPMIEKAAGKGKSVVRVSAVMDFEKSEKMEEIFDPDRVVVRSEQRLEESSSDSDGRAGGVPGVTSNLQGRTGEGGSESSNTSKKSETINYEITRITKKTIAPVGKLLKLSVAVMIDGTYEESEEGGRKYIPRSAEELKTYENLVKNVVGFDGERGDRIEVSSMPFEVISEGIEGEGLLANKGDAFWIAIARNASIAVLGLIFFFFVLRPLVKWLVSVPGNGPLMEGGLMTVGEMEAELAGGGEKGLSESREGAVKGAQVDADLVHGVVKGWMEEQREGNG